MDIRTETSSFMRVHTHCSRDSPSAPKDDQLLPSAEEFLRRILEIYDVREEDGGFLIIFQGLLLVYCLHCKASSRSSSSLRYLSSII